MVDKWRLSRADAHSKLPTPSTEKLIRSDSEPAPRDYEEIDPSSSQPSTPVDEPKSPVDETLPTLGKLPSHSPLAMSNYPPLWSKDSKPKPRPRPTSTQSEPTIGVPITTLNAVLSTTSSREDKKRFQERDLNNRHQYLQDPHQPYLGSHPRFNVFGADIGPLGKRPPLFGGGGWGMGKKRK